MRRDAEPRPGGVFWPTLGMIAFLLLWLAICAAGFLWLYGHFSSDLEAAADSLQWLTWPFVFLAALGPIALLTAIGGLRIVRELLALQQLIARLPALADQLKSATGGFDELGERLTGTVAKIENLRTQLITDVSRVNEALVVDATSDAQESVDAPEHIKEFMRLYEFAQKLFYGALGRYNKTAAEPLFVQGGWTGFKQVVDALRSNNIFRTTDTEMNQRVADFVLRAFQLERTTRGTARASLTSPTVNQLRLMAPPR